MRALQIFRVINWTLQSLASTLHVILLHPKKEQKRPSLFFRKKGWIRITQNRYVNVRNYCTYIFHWVYDVCKWEWRQRWQSKGRQYMPRSQPRLWWCLHCPFALKGQCLGLQFRKAFQHLKIDQNINYFQIIIQKHSRNSLPNELLTWQ